MYWKVWVQQIGGLCVGVGGVKWWMFDQLDQFICFVCGNGCGVGFYEGYGFLIVGQFGGGDLVGYVCYLVVICLCCKGGQVDYEFGV